MKNNGFFSVVLFFFIILCDFPLNCAAQSSAITAGINSLANSQLQDGSWGSDSFQTDPTTTTAAVLHTLSELDGNNSAYQAGTGWVTVQSLNATDHISRRILTGAPLPEDPNLLIANLDNMRNAWGGTADYDVNNLDSALALLALKKLNSNDSSSVSYALNFLLSKQNPDGGWGFADASESELYYTALADLALQQFSNVYTLNNPISKGQSYLLANQNGDGGFGFPFSTVSETAVVCLALLNAQLDSPELILAMQYLTTAQLSNGSWENDPFETSLALLSLARNEKAHFPPAPSMVVGKVVSSVNGQPLTGVSVTINGNTSLTTIADGTFTFGNLTPGTYSVQFALTGFQPFSKSVTLAVGATSDLGNLVMSKIVVPVTAINGTVTESGTGLPVVGATVNVSGASVANAVTDSTGGYVIEGLSPGSIVIVISKDGYTSALVGATVVTNQTLIFSPALLKEGATQPGGGTSTSGVFGQVIDTDTGQPLSGVSVSVSITGIISTTLTDGDGAFSLSLLKPETAYITCSAPGYLPFSFIYPLHYGIVLDLGQIGMRPEGSAALLPDLIINEIDLTSAVNDPQTLAISGSTLVTVKNVGLGSARAFVGVIAFYDANKNNVYDSGTDLQLAYGNTRSVLAPGGNEVVEMALRGVLPFRDAPVLFWVDSLQNLEESNETNNIFDSFVYVCDQAELADLTAGMLRIVDNGYGVFRLTVRVGNGGSLAVSENIPVNFYEGDPAVGGRLLGTINLAELADNAFTDVTLEDVHSITGSAPIYAMVDPVGVFQECNEGNNIIQAPAPLILADLTVSDLQIADNGAGVPVTVAFTVTNSGAISSSNQSLVAFYSGSPLAGGVLLGTMNFGTLAPGASQQLSYNGVNGNDLGVELYVVVDADDRVNEYSECNNTIHLTVPQSNSGLVVVNTDSQTYGSSQPVQVLAQVTNTNALPGEFTVRFQIEDQYGIVVANLPTGAVGMINGGVASSSGITWNTGNYLAGTYLVRAYLDSSSVQAVHTTASSFAIINSTAVPTLSLRTTTDKTTYLPGETVKITNLITNQTGNTIVDNTILRLTISDLSGATVYSNEQLPGQLLPGMQKPLNSLFALGALPSGQYTLKGEVVDGSSGQLWASGQAVFAVAATATTGAGLTGSFDIAEQVYMGRPLTATFSVTNNGNEDVNNLAVRISIINPATDTLLQTVEQLISVTRQASYAGTVSVDTAQLELGLYMAVLSVTTPAMAKAKTLGSDNFEVLPSLEVKTTSTDPVNLLVWVNDGCSRKNKVDIDDDSDCSHGDGESYHGESGNGLSKASESYAAEHECTGDGEYEEEEEAGKECVRTGLLEPILTAAVDFHSLIYDRDEFERALRSPYFTDIMILGDQAPLTDHADIELREMNYAGTGLISALWSENTSAEQIFGIKVGGNFANDCKFPRSVSTIASPVTTDGLLSVGGRLLKVEVADKQAVVGWVSGGECDHEDDDHKATSRNEEDRHDQDEPYPAIVLGAYGNGKSVFFNFNIGAELKSVNLAQFGEMLAGAIADVHTPRATDAFRPYQLVPTATSLHSLGGAFDLRLTETYSPELQLFDPLLGAWLTDNPQITETTLGVGGQKNLFNYVLMPDRSGVFSITTEIGFIFGGEYNFFDSRLTNFAVQLSAQSLLQEILTEIKALSGNGVEKSKIKTIVNSLERLEIGADVDRSDIEKNIADIGQAINVLLELERAEVIPIRLKLDELLRIEQSRWYFQVK